MTAYIKLVVTQELAPKTYALWYHTVEQSLPSGMISQTEISPGKLSRLYRKQTPKGQHCYVIPLVRDLDSSEIYQTVEAWNQAWPKGDFVIDWSQPVGIHAPSLDMATHKIEQALESWAKTQHQRWMSQHLKDGWRFGVKLSTRDRTHPWLQPWESLPPQAQATNLQAARDLLDALGQFGYTVVQKTQA
jgi:hypothetical protein